jgi:hypothetical protein
MIDATSPIDRRPTCAGIRADGSPCRSQVLCDGTHCYVHAPGRQQERAEARRKGGRNRATSARLRKLMPPRLVPVFDQLEVALADVLAGELDPRQATAAAAVARALVAVLTAGELEERLRRLEERGTA